MVLDLGPRKDEEIGPETLRTIRMIEGKDVQPVADVSNLVAGTLADLRDKWAKRPGSEH